MNLREIHNIGARTRESIVHPDACGALARRGILLTGLSRARPGFRFVRHRPGMVQVLACRGGRGEVWMEGKWRPCTAGEAYVTPSAAPHAYRATEAWNLAWVIYDPAAVEGRPPHDEPRIVRGDVESLHDAVAGLYREQTGPADQTVAEHWGELIDIAARRLILPNRPAERLVEVWRAVDADLARPWTLEDLATLAGISTEHLRRLCRMQHGCSPMRQVTRLRMQRALQRLTHTDQTIEAIAREAGYENAFAFSTAFRRNLGVSPSDFRRRQREKYLA